MVILVILGGILLLALIFGPQLWIRHVLSRAQADRPDLPGTGADLARHLLDEAGLRSVRVEETPDGDHYDPDARVVRLTPPHFGGRSIAAVAVATHEVAHAVQHAREEPGFRRRQALVAAIAPVFRLAQIVMATIPLLLILFHSPAFIALQLGAIMALLSLRVAIHAVTLPVELDASFNKALPVLEAGGYLAPADMPEARRVLKAAAFTYVAAALVTLLDVLRWFRR
ncbi:zinc metallopeptidase [Falsiroseomonas ponticola]|uniref:zinc metallopeptidase n=1 Tax=Falsiroseomonas ponticola TaxID=2786951 RepID=UPI001932F255|nr:zinc metallopeptidase [Roseomonas ponticola]